VTGALLSPPAGRTTIRVAGLLRVTGSTPRWCGNESADHPRLGPPAHGATPTLRFPWHAVPFFTVNSSLGWRYRRFESRHGPAGPQTITATLDLRPARPGAEPDQNTPDSGFREIALGRAGEPPAVTAIDLAPHRSRFNRLHRRRHDAHRHGLTTGSRNAAAPTAGHARSSTRDPPDCYELPVGVDPSY
jgi:hypothetical protein